MKKKLIRLFWGSNRNWFLCLLLLAPSLQAQNMREAITNALQSSPQVQSAGAIFESSRLQNEGSRQGFYPSLDLAFNAGVDNYKNSARTNSSQLTVQTYKLTATQPLFDGFATLADIDRKKARFEGAQARFNDARATVAIDVAQAYFGLLRAADLVDLGKQNVLVHRNHVLKMTEIIRSDAGRKSELLQAEARLAQVSANFSLLQGRLQQAREEYTRVTGFAPRDLQYEGPVAVPTSLDVAQSLAREKNVALIVAETEVRAGKEEVKIAKASYLPKIALELGISNEKNLAGSETTTEDTSLYLTGRWNLFRGGADTLQANIAAQNVEAARQAQIDAGRELDKRVANIWHELVAQRAALRDYAAQVKFAIETRDNQDAQFKVGRKTLLDLLNAELELYSAKNSEVGARYEVLLSTYRINGVIGQLLAKLGVDTK